MSVLRCDLWWSAAQHATLKVDSTQPIGDLVAELRWQAGHRLPEPAHSRASAEFGLFRERDNQRILLADPRQTLAQADVRDGATLWLADIRRPWWLAESLDGAPVIAHPCRCHIQPAGGARSAVPPGGLQLSRGYLLATLPRTLLLQEQARSLAGRGSRLQAVSRRPHCELSASGGRWLLRAFAATFVENHCYNYGMTFPLDGAITLLLGRKGWPVAVQLEPIP